LPILIILGIIIAAALGGAAFSYMRAFYHPRGKGKKKWRVPHADQYSPFSERSKQLVEELSSYSYETVRIKAKDGVTLSAKYFHVADGAPIHIEFHGYKSRAISDFCGGSKLIRGMGHNILLVDHRAHGESGGHTITFGIKERYDCLEWVKYIVGRFGKDQKIFLVGISMGAATVLMASELELPGNVAGIIADSPYSSPEEIIRKVCREEMGLPDKLVFPFVILGGFLFGGFDIRESSAVSAAKKCRIPTLVIHGENDLFVPCEMSERIYRELNCKKQLFTVPEAGHGLGYMVDTEGYERTVADFINGLL